MKRYFSEAQRLFLVIRRGKVGAVARELAAQAEIPRTMPQRIADLMRELHRRLRNVDQEPP